MQEVARSIGQHLNGYKVVITKSTVPIGTARLLEGILAEHGVENAGVASNPEFLAQGNAVELAVPCKRLGLKGEAISFDFHWCDNPTELKDPISLCTSGDSAPNRRFNYRCVWKR